MSKRLLLGVVLATGLLASQVMAADHSLVGDVRNAPNEGNIYNDVCTENLFQGDLGAEIGIGCSNASGTSGGPNDIVVGVTASLTPPFVLTSHFYNIFTQVSPTITALTFGVWAGGGTPGGLVASQPGLPFGPGSFTVNIAPAISVGSSQFFLGHIQPQTNVGMRWGLDTSSGSAGSSYIRAPTCGASTFTLVDALGFPGNWVMSVCADGGTPVELTSWGSVKAAYK